MRERVTFPVSFSPKREGFLSLFSLPVTSDVDVMEILNTSNSNDVCI